MYTRPRQYLFCALCCLLYGWNVLFFFFLDESRVLLEELELEYVPEIKKLKAKALKKSQKGLS